MVVGYAADKCLFYADIKNHTYFKKPLKIGNTTYPPRHDKAKKSFKKAPFLLFNLLLYLLNEKDNFGLDLKAMYCLSYCLI